MSFLIIVIVASILCSFLASLLEACLLSLSSTDLLAVQEKKPGAGRIWKSLREDIQKPLTVTVIVNAIVYTFGATLSGAKVDTLFGAKWLPLYSLLYALLMIQWGEIIPKAVGVRFNRKIAIWTAQPFKYIITLATPFVSAINWINKPLRSVLKPQKAFDAMKEIGVLLRFAVLNKLISPQEESIVSRSMKLSSTTAKDIMVESKDIKALSSEMSLLDALVEAHVHHHTRYPLTEGGNIDKIIGYVNMKDIVSALKFNPSNPSLRGIARPIIEVSPTMPVSLLITRFTRGYQHIAVVKSEDGKTLGLITLEDVLESIVGEIEDEYDILPTHVHKLSDVRFIVGGGVLLTKLREATGFELPDEQKTISDWLIALKGTVPSVETQFKHGDIVITVRKLRRSRINEVIVEKITPDLTS